MATWDLWFPDVLVHVTTAPDPLVRQALCRAAREFFKKTRAWTEWLDPATGGSAVAVEYDFDLPPQTELICFEQATLNGRPLSVDSFRQRPSDWTRHPEGNQAVVTRDLQTYHLVGDFAATDVVQAQVSLRPTLKATGIPDHLAERYLEAIAEGAKAILHMTPRADFTDPGMGAVERAMFEAAIANCTVDAYMGHTNQVPRARPKWL